MQFRAMYPVVVAAALSSTAEAIRSVAVKSVAKQKHAANASLESETWESQFDTLMTKMVVTFNPLGINDKCQPYIKKPKGESKGLVWLQHGYTACPGFWEPMVDHILPTGFTVMVPLLVGHGRTPKVSDEADADGKYVVRDYLEDFPTDEQEYISYSDDMMNIVESYRAANPGKPVVLTGISLGGAVASYSALSRPMLFDRVMLMNPFLSVPGALGEDLNLSVLPHLIPEFFPLIENLVGDGGRVGWGEKCEQKYWPTDDRKGGHGGTCQFSVYNFNATLNFGLKANGLLEIVGARRGMFTGGVLDRTRQINEYEDIKGRDVKPQQLEHMKVQLLATEKDGAVSNGRIHYASEVIGKVMAHKDHFGYCVQHEEFGHVYISPQDDKDRDDWWLDAQRIQGGRTVFEQLTDFIAEGKLFPVSHKGTVELDKVQDDKTLKGDPVCDTYKV